MPTCRRHLLTSVMVWPMLAATAHAQSSAAATPPGADAEIIVTAQYKGQSVQQVPLAITALSGATLEQRGLTNVSAVSAAVPNVLIAPTTNGPAVNLYIRGVGQDDTTPAMEPGVGVYVDDVYYPTLVGSQLELLDLSRLEVLKGPQGTLAGRNSMGGALKLYTKDPSGRRDAYVSVEYGSYNSVNLRAGTNFTLLPDALFARITGFYRSSEGYVTDYDYNCTHKGSLGSFTATGANCVIGHDGGVNIGGIRGALLYDQGNGLKVRLSGEYIRQRNEPNASTLLATAGNDGVGDNAPSQNGVPYSYSGTSAWAGSPFIAYSPYAGIAAGDSFTHSPYVNYANYCNSSGRSGTNSYAGYCLSRKNNIDSYTASLAIDYRVAEKLTLKSITALSGYKADYTDDGDKSPLFTDLTDTQFDNHYLSQEVRLSGTLRRLDFTVGGIYTDQATVQGGTVDFSTFAMQQNDRIPLTTGALFAHADWRVAGGLHLIGGLRWTHEEKNYIFRRATINGQPNSTVPALIGFDNYTPAAYSGSHTDYRLALQYAFSHDIMAYVQTATGFKGGGVNPRPFSVAQALPFGQEKLTAYEAGVKSMLFGRRLKLNAAIFFNDYTGKQLGITTCTIGLGPCNVILNAGNVRESGQEVEFDLHPVPALSLHGSASWLQSHYTYLTSDAIGSGLTYGMAIPYQIRSKFNLGADYRLDLGRAGSLTPSVDYAHQTGFYTTTVNIPVVGYNPAYGVWSARLSWKNREGDLEVYVRAENLGDAVYYYNNYPATINMAVTGAIAPPREVFAGIKKTF